MEYAPGGDLFRYVLRHKAARLAEAQARWIFQQLVIGLDFCHRSVRPRPDRRPKACAWLPALDACTWSGLARLYVGGLWRHASRPPTRMRALQGVANRDLKLENMLLDRDGQDGTRPLLKICDFGYSKHEMNSSAKTGVGTPIYMAPEIIHGGNRYDAKVRARNASLTAWHGQAHARCAGPGRAAARGRRYAASLLRVCASA